MLIATVLTPSVRTVVWTGALLWMGGACLFNALRCGRTHCRFTGPFFVGMAALTIAHGTGLALLGEYGWIVLGVVIVIGNAAIWWGSERLLGRFSTSRNVP